MLTLIKNFALDTLFPISCLICDASDTWLCQQCLDKIDLLTFQVCPYCETTEVSTGTICPRCKAKFISKWEIPALDNLIIATSYKNSSVARLVHVFKYSFVPELGRPLAELIAKAILNNHLPLPDYIIPVPLHPRRERWRGFNQAGILAQNLSSALSPGLPIPIMDNTLIRKKFTRPQMKIHSYQERKQNIRDSFGLSDPYLSGEKNMRGKKILLIDDISTTGSTMLECAKALKNIGAKKVYGAVIARQEMK